MNLSCQGHIRNVQEASIGADQFGKPMDVRLKAVYQTAVLVAGPLQNLMRNGKHASKRNAELNRLQGDQQYSEPVGQRRSR